MTFKDLEIVTTKLGAPSIRNNIYGEILHNPFGPWAEARSLYVRQTGLLNRLRNAGELAGRPLVLFDVGLGAGFNVLAALEAFSTLDNSRPLKILSFEINFDLFDFALENIASFPENKPFEKHLREFRKNGKFEFGNLFWGHKGSFLDQNWSNDEKAEIIFFDPYSSKSNHEMWTMETFEIVAKALNHNTPNCMSTYSCSTSVRTAMLLAGLYVGMGESSNAEKETTFASTYFSEVRSPLEKRWLQRWTRSHDCLPKTGSGRLKMDRELIYDRLLRHPQFKNVELAK